jgi:hypothetical protein
VFNTETNKDATPNETEAIFASVNNEGEPADKNPVTPLMIITGKSIQVLRVLKICSARLWHHDKQWDFSPVDAKYSSSISVQ